MDITIAHLDRNSAEGDAALIAAAPDLLAAAKEIIDCDVKGNRNDLAMLSLWDAVAKAEGAK